MSDLQAQFEVRLRAALDPGRIDSQFSAQLRSKLAAAAQTPRPRRLQFNRRAGVAALALLLLAASLLAIGPQRVLAQVLGWLGYVPGVGFVEAQSGLRVLEQPQSQTREGIRVDVLDGLVDDEHTIVTIRFDGIRQDQKPTSEEIPGCWQNPALRLPDGTRLQVIGGEGGGGLSWFQERLTYPALPLEINEAILEVPCVPEVLPGRGPEDWQLPLHFVPAPEGFEVLPVLPVQTVQPATPVASPHGFSLSVEDYVELDDGYLLRGRFSWDESAYTQPDFWLLELALFDAQGQRVPTEATYPAPVEGQAYVTWTLQTNTKQISSPVRVVLEEISIRALLDFAPANSFEIDLGPGPHDGQAWDVNKALQLGDHRVTVGRVRFEERADGTYAVLSSIDFDPSEITTLNLMDQDNLSQMLWWSGAGVSEGQIEIGIGYDYLPSGVHRFWVDNYFERLPGPWEASISLPSTAGVPAQTDAACLTQELWQTLPASAPLPFSGGDRLLLEGPAPDGVYFPSLFLADPRGEQRTPLAPGGWGALSPDGRQVAYTDGAGLHVLSVASQQDRLISTEGSAYSPAWSSSADRLAFIKGGDGVWLIDADGKNERRLPGTHADMIGLAGWLPDGQHIVVSTNVPAGSQVQKVNIETGAVEDLFLIDNHKGGFTALSPDGEHIAYSGELFGSINYGLYVSRLDGSQQQLVAQPGDQVLFMAGAWSPDGQWLLVNPLDTSALEPSPQHPIAVGPSTCAVMPLSGLSGSALGWASAPEQGE